MEKFEAIIMGSGQAGNPLAICAGGSELMSLLQVAVMSDIKYEQLRDTMFARPTYAEAINNLFSPIHLKPGGAL